MALKYVQGHMRFIRLNADAAPDLTSHPDLKPGDETWISDTDVLHRWNGAAWVVTVKNFSGV